MPRVAAANTPSVSFLLFGSGSLRVGAFASPVLVDLFLGWFELRLPPIKLNLPLSGLNLPPIGAGPPPASANPPPAGLLRGKIFAAV
ncbi:MAG: hypothetical protein LBH35_06925 [Treponema sp.]|jgi:hypothetical protein|nr:hypothetical protein [Treponema sp.]